MKATLVHIETATEFYKNDSLYVPTANEKLLYEGVESTKTIVTPETYDALTATEQTNYTAVNNRDYEAEENSKRKYLNGVLPEYGSIINRQIRTSLNDQPISLS